MQNKKLDKFFFYTTIIFRPHFWALRSRYNKNIDEFIVDIIDRNVKGDYTGGYSISYGEISVWIGSYPFSYTTLFNNPVQGRASRYTIHRYKKYVDRLEKEQHEKEMNGLSEKEYLSLERIAMKMFTENKN